MRRTASRGWSTPGGSSSFLSLGKANLHGTCVSFQSFGAGQRGDCRRNRSQRRGSEFLDRDNLHEIGGGQSASDASRAGRWQNMIGTGGVIARGFGAAGS